MLPSRDRQAEQCFVESFRDQMDEQRLEDAIAAAMAERRVQLAAKLTGLIDPKQQLAEDSPVHQAQRALNFLLLRKRTVSEDLYWREAEQAWAQWVHERRIKRAKQRMRPSKDPRGRRPWISKR